MHSFGMHVSEASNDCPPLDYWYSIGHTVMSKVASESRFVVL